MKKIIALSLFLLLVISVISCSRKSNSGADNSLSDIKKKNVFIIGLDDSFPPMGYRDEKNEIVGFDVELAKEVANRMGVSFKAQPIDWNAKELELSSGNIDCIWNGFTVTEERRKNVLFSKPYLVNKQVYIVKKASDIKGIHFSNKIVGVQQGSTGEMVFEETEEFKNNKMVSYKDFLTALLDLKSGGVDAVLIDSTVANQQLSLSSGSDFRIIEEGLSDEQYAVGFRLTDKALCAEVEKHLDNMKKEGFVQKIADKYGIKYF